MLYLVEPTAPAPAHKLLPLRHIELLRVTCSDAALAPLDRFAEAGAFQDAYHAVDTGLCTDTRNGAIWVAAFAWVSLLSLVVLSGAKVNDTASESEA